MLSAIMLWLTFIEHNKHLLLTEVVNRTPILERHSKPFTITWPDVDVYGTKVEVFLMS